MSSAPVFRFGTRADPVDPLFRPEFEATKAQWKQVHGIRIADVRGPREACGETDGFYTESVTAIHVVTADCVPILLARRDGGAVAALHAGWRGVFGHYPRAFADFVRARGGNPADWTAHLGPSIRPCCFEVGEDLVEKFGAEFPTMDAARLSPAFRRIDLHAVLKNEFRELGVRDVTALDECTKCARNADGSFKYFSFRREGTGVRQYSSIKRTSLK